MRAGHWRDREEQRPIEKALDAVRPLKIGFHIPAWISPFVQMWECAAAFLKGQKGQPDYLIKLRDFNNGFAAVPWKSVEAARKEDHILKLRDASLPAGVVPGNGVVACLLAGIDTQDDGFWYEIRAFGYGMSFDSWGIRNGFVTSFEALQKVLWQDIYKDAAGNGYQVYFAVQDAMGHRTSEVYDFCRLYRGLILPSQGKERQAQPFAYSNIEYYPGTKKPIPGGIQLVRFDSNFFKNKLSSILDVNPGDPGCWYYNNELTLEWARQMTAEGINPDTRLWENPKNRPNHAWDCSVLTLLASEILGVRFWVRPEEESTDKDGGPIIVARSGFISKG